MKKYYLESMNWNVLGQVLWETLSENEFGNKAFKQDFQRAWTILEFDSPQDALKAAREYLKNEQAYLSEDHSQIMVVYGNEVLSSFRISVDNE